MKLDYLRNTTKIVEKWLERSEKCRNSDYHLWLCVLQDIKPSLLGVSFMEALKTLEGSDYPSLETISRCRRRVQQLRPELKGSKEVSRNRAELEDSFMVYSRGSI